VKVESKDGKRSSVPSGILKVWVWGRTVVEDSLICLNMRQMPVNPNRTQVHIERCQDFLYFSLFFLIYFAFFPFMFV